MMINFQRTGSLAELQNWRFLDLNKISFVCYISRELNLGRVDFLIRIGGENWSYKCGDTNIFVKTSQDVTAGKILLFGEFESLKAIEQTSVVRVPKPLKVFSVGDRTTLLVTELLNFTSLDIFQGELGKQLANLHKHNMSNHSNEAINKFGFHTNVCCGKIPNDNSWNDNWVDFYCDQRLAPQIEMIEKKSNKNQEIAKLWTELRKKIPQLFEGIVVFPSILHGDLWSGNVGETKEEPVIFDPASFYGHHEFDLAITHMFGGFNQTFYHEYHKLIPQEPGFENRKLLYELFHYLNHWNHFGSGYEAPSLNIMHRLISKTP